MSKNRILFIDNLRALSLIGVAIIHIFSFHLSDSFHYAVWNSLQFVVVSFIFCSGYVSGHYENQLATVSSILPWYLKRFNRLYWPFFFYFISHFVLFFLFPHLFTHFGMQNNLLFLINSLLLFGGANTNWLPLIFLELTVLLPFLFLFRRNHVLWVYILFAIVVTGFFTLKIFPYSQYRLVMWIPWSLVFLTGISYPKIIQKSKIGISIGNLMVFIGSYVLLSTAHRSLLFYDNKYPPTLYYLSFGLFVTLLSTFLISKITFPNSIQTILSFISKNSYALFFIHYIVLDFFESTIISHSILLELVVVSLVSGGSFVLIQYCKKIAVILFQHTQQCVANNSL